VVFQRGEYAEADRHLREAVGIAEQRFAVLIEADASTSRN
jgi:hypothetical protein